jgi:hypothetical protein
MYLELGLIAAIDRYLLYRCRSLCPWLREDMTLELWIGAALFAASLAFLITAMLRPENF